jgi:hypothetical protein
LIAPSNRARTPSSKLRVDLEDGLVGDDVLGVASFVHYGVTTGSGTVLGADAFLMKGEETAPFTEWAGNPATEIQRPAPFHPDGRVRLGVRPRAVHHAYSSPPDATSATMCSAEQWTSPRSGSGSATPSHDPRNRARAATGDRPKGPDMGPDAMNELPTLIAVPLFHATGCHMQLVTSFYLGGPAVVLPRFTAREFLAAIAEERISSTASHRVAGCESAHCPD